jgi:hypothetical protein
LQRDILVAFGEADIGGFWRTAVRSRTLKRHAPQLSDKSFKRESGLLLTQTIHRLPLNKPIFG